MELNPLITRIPLFQGLSEDDLKDLQGRLEPIEIPKGDVLFQKGDAGSKLFIVEQGAVKIVLPSSQGAEVIVTIFKEGDFFGEMSLLDHMPRSADAIAVSQSTLLALDGKKFLDFLIGNRAAVSIILATLSHRLRQTDSLLEDSCFLNLSARVAKNLKTLAERFGEPSESGIRIQLKLTQSELAHMVGATRESINKELRQLRDEGVIRLDAQTITIVAPLRLQLRIPAIS
jgi:CRP/FNR family transcriptional regulator, cyclic AMP receptor protein